MKKSNQTAIVAIIFCSVLVFLIYFVTQDMTFGSLRQLFDQKEQDELQEMNDSAKEIGDTLKKLEDPDEKMERPKTEKLPEPKPVEPKAPANPKKEYILPNSDSSYITEADLKGLSAKECRLARNELYARHGRIFNDKSLQRYFEQFSWYQGEILSDEFPESLLNKYEQHNRDVIVKYEKKMGYR